MPPYKWFPQHTFSRMIYTWDHIKVTVARGHLASREEGRMVLLAVPARDREVQQREDHSTWKTRVRTICIDLDGPSSQHLWVPSTFATAKLWSAFKSFLKTNWERLRSYTLAKENNWKGFHSSSIHLLFWLPCSFFQGGLEVQNIFQSNCRRPRHCTGNRWKDPSWSGGWEESRVTGGLLFWHLLIWLNHTIIIA